MKRCCNSREMRADTPLPRSLRSAALRSRAPTWWSCPRSWRWATLGRLEVAVGAREVGIGPRITWGHLCKVSLDPGCPWDPSAASHHVSRRRWSWSWAACTAWWGACWCSASYSNLIKSICRPSSGVQESTVKHCKVVLAQFLSTPLRVLPRHTVNLRNYKLA